MLKGGVLLAIFDVRRPTQDLDIAARALDNDFATVIAWLGEIVAVEVDDGLSFDAGSLRAELIKEGDP